MWEAVAAWGTAIGILAGLAAMLGKKYFEKELELEQFRKNSAMRVMDSLNDTVKEHKAAIANHAMALEKIHKDLINTDARMVKLASELKEYSDGVGARIIAFESKVQRLSEELIIIKGGKPKGPTNGGTKS